MEKDTLTEIINDLKYKRDALGLAHQALKKENDKWNKVIICLSLFGGLVEATKLQLELETSFWKLAPIFISSLLACIGSLIKFKKYPESMEVLVTNNGQLTTILNKARTHDTLDKDLLNEYNLALERLETSVYPDLRLKYLLMSQKNLLKIMKGEVKFFNQIELVNQGQEVLTSDNSLSSGDEDKGSHHGEFSTHPPPSYSSNLLPVVE